MENITMDTDWGARGAQLTGGQVQSFIKGQLTELHEKHDELSRQISEIQSNNDIQTLRQEIVNVNKEIDSLESLLNGISENRPDWGEADKESANYIKNKPEIPTVETAPDGTLKSYTNTDGTVVMFKIGDFVRYKDAEGNYVFYQVNDMSPEGDIYWAEAGSNESSSLFEKVAISLTTNQHDNSDLIGKRVTISYGDQSIELVWGGSVLVQKILMQTQYTVSVESAEGYSSTAPQSFTSIGGNTRNINFVYSCEKLSVNVSSDNGADCSGRTITVTDTSTSAVIGTATGGTGVFKIPFGTSYRVSVDGMDGYDSPPEQTFTAGTATRNVSMQYIYNPIKKGYYIIDDSVKDPSTKITLTEEVTQVIGWIRDNSHRVLAKKTSDGVCKVIRLLDTDGTKYFDGTPAPVTSTDYDVMMMMPEFWYTAENFEADKHKIWFADGNPNDGKVWHKWDHNHLIAVYEAYASNSKAYSVSGKSSTGNVSQETFKQYARNKGAGYHLVDWQAHCIMGYLFYGYYANTDCQSVCGSGTNSYTKNTGQTDSLGMADTDSSNGNSMSINFWGLENWWGNKYEWIDNVLTGENHTLKIMNVLTGNVERTVQGFYLNSVYPSKMIHGDNLDLLGKDSNGSTTSGYADYQYLSEASRVVRRSNSYSGAGGGVAYAGANNDSSYTDSSVGSRLAFSGAIVEAESVSSFTS